MYVCQKNPPASRPMIGTKIEYPREKSRVSIITLVIILLYLEGKISLIGFIYALLFKQYLNNLTYLVATCFAQSRPKHAMKCDPSETTHFSACLGLDWAKHVATK